MRKGQRGKKIGPSSSRAALSPKDRLRQQAYGLRNVRNFTQAKPLLEELYKLEPDNVPLALDLGEAYMETEDFASATSLYAKLIEKDPKNINAVTNLGGSLIRQGKLSDARSILEYALQLDPKSIHARINLGSVLQASGERKANLDNALEAVQIDPSSSLAFNNLGSAFSDMAMFKEARHAYETAIMLDPNQVDALINLAAVEARLGDSKASAEMYERVLRLLPKEAEQRAEAVKFYAAFEYLKQGVLEKGWDYYEGGFSPLVPAKGARTPRRNFDVPRWDGQPLNGKTLLVWREQGLGDELLFATCLHELEALGGNIIVECDARLVTVFQRSFPQYTIRAETFMPNHGMKSPFSDFDLHLPMGSLMKHFRRDIKDFERSGAYVKPDPLRLADFQKRLKPHREKGRLVGICWRSGKLDPVRNLSYTTLDEWGDNILQQSGYVFINLQYGECEEELCAAETKHKVTILRWKDLDLRNDLEGVFALMACLDGVVSVQTAVLVMAGVSSQPTVGINASGWTRLGFTESSPWFSNLLRTFHLSKAPDLLETNLLLRFLAVEFTFTPTVLERKSSNYFFSIIERIGCKTRLREVMEKYLEMNPWSSGRELIKMSEALATPECITLSCSLIKEAYKRSDSAKDGLVSIAGKKDLPADLRVELIKSEQEQERLSTEGKLQGARTLAEINQMKLAEDLIKSAYLEDKTLNGALGTLAYAYYEKYDYKNAIRLYKEEAELGRIRQAQLLNYAEALAHCDYLADALSLVELAYNSDVKQKNGNARIALILKKMGMHERALKICELDVSLKRIKGGCWNLFYELVALNEGVEQAVKLVTKHYVDDSDARNCFISISKALLKIGDFEKANQIASRDIINGRNTKPYRLVYAEILSSMGDVDRAIECVEQVYENDTRIKNGYIMISRGLAKKKGFDGALKLAQKDRNLNKLTPPFELLLACLEAKVGLPLKATSLLPGTRLNLNNLVLYMSRNHFDDVLYDKHILSELQKVAGKVGIEV